MSNTPPPIIDVDRENNVTAWLSNEAAIVIHQDDLMRVSYCRPADQGIPYKDDITVGESVENVAADVIARYDNCNTTHELRNEFGSRAEILLEYHSATE